MPRAADVAAFILNEVGPTTAMKLQKLVYYSQAWSLVWDERPMFSDEIEAWANGPVVPALYNQHRGHFRVGPGLIAGRPQDLDRVAADTIQGVLAYYGDKSAQYLSDLTHAEAPWQKARGDLSPGASCNTAITHEDMAEFYGSLPPDA